MSAEQKEQPLVMREDRPGTTTLTLNRPLQYNALSQALIAHLQEELDRIANDNEIRVVVLAASGKAFCAGHDLKELQANPGKVFSKNLFAECSRMMLTLNRMPQVVIAEVQGIATAAGCQLVAACDLAVASAEARFATSGINVGLFCSTPAVPISRKLSRKHAFEMLVTGEFINAEKACEWGLINRVTPPDQLDVETQKLVAVLLSKSPLALRTGKQMFYQQLEKNMEEAYAYASEVIAANVQTEDVKEGIEAFLQKRPPQWKS